MTWMFCHLQMCKYLKWRYDAIRDDGPQANWFFGEASMWFVRREAAARAMETRR